MTGFTIEDMADAPDWLMEYHDTGREPAAKADNRILFRVTPEDGKRFGELSGSVGVELLLQAGEVVEWNVLGDEQFPQAAGEIFNASHEGQDGEETYRLEMQSSCMHLINYRDGVLSWFDTGTMWLDDRYRLFASVDEALQDEGEMWFSPSEALVSVYSAVHSAPEIASRLRWLEYVDAHEFTINGEAWRFEPGKGVTRVTKDLSGNGEA